MASIAQTAEWKALEAHVTQVQGTHLKDLLQDDARTESMIREHNGIYVDFSRQNATQDTIKMLIDLANKAGVKDKVQAMFSGEHINTTEDRAVLHVALRAPRDAVIEDRGQNVVPEVWAVLDKIKGFTEKIRSGEWVGVTGKPLTDVVAIGIGGSALGPAFIHSALATDPVAAEAAAGRSLTFLANVDPVDAVDALHSLNPETTLAIIVSKTFTTAETMRNARTVRAWLTGRLGASAVAQHMVAVSTNLPAVAEFGIDPNNAFGFWDWVGGRFSASSAVGIVPLSLQYSFDVMEQFLGGMRDVDEHFLSAPLENNIPALMGLLNVWNATFMGKATCAILPYCQALSKFAPHIQQLSMESNGKGVDINGTPLPYEAGEIDFGEPGTNGQHSFYQLLHQGRVVPAEFVGVVSSQQDIYMSGEPVSSHEELMCNYFAQPDALALGKTAEELQAEGVAEALISHKTFHGNRPSLSILLPALNAFTLGQLLAVYEHRIATSGFVWGINSFDQWGVELGKVLANRVRGAVQTARKEGRELQTGDGFNTSTVRLLNRFLANKITAPAAAFAILNASVLPSVKGTSHHPTHRVVLKSFLLRPNDKMLYQNKPLLVPEEELTASELALLRSDQNDREVDALQGMSERAKQRAAIVQQLVAEFDGDSLSDEVLQKIQRQWSRFSITEEDEVSSNQASELSTNHHGGFVDDAAYPDEDEEHLAATMALEFKLDEYQEEDYNDDQVLNLLTDITVGEDINADSASGEVELVAPIEEDEEEAYPDELDAILHGTDTGVDPDFSFRDVLSACLTLECLKEAHTRQKPNTQFNFPHALLMGWQDSAVGRLAEHLSSHPQVINSAERASEFFTTKCHDSPSSGCSRPAEADYIRHTLQRDAVTAAKGEIMSFESSIQYASAGDLLATQLSETLPWVKIVTTFREPISRAFSVLAHRAFRENTGCLATQTVDLYSCLIHELLESTESGSYAQAMGHWMRAFPKEQLYVVQYEGLSGADGQAGLQGVKTFLGLDPALPFENLPVDTINTDGWPIRKEQYQDLVATVRVDTENLAQLIENNGLGSSQEWLARWEAIWQNTLNSCDADGQCHIQL